MKEIRSGHEKLTDRHIIIIIIIYIVSRDSMILIIDQLRVTVGILLIAFGSRL